jgi:hypothetical protein
VVFKFDGSIASNTTTVNISAPYLPQSITLTKTQLVDLQTMLNRLSTPTVGLVQLVITIDPSAIKLLQQTASPTNGTGTGTIAPVK